MDKFWVEHRIGARTRRIVQAALICAVAFVGMSVGAGAAEKTLRVGAPLPLTGPLSPEGLKQSV